ncbi:MAG: hypothetical protein LAQ69_33515 [Acidobacteriia bacterium]|nr:hypothetical protein [Terriglobia bacterium]
MVFAILKALSRAVERDLATLESLKVNNFFLFVALLIYGALVSGVKPVSAEPFLLLLGFLLLFPLSSDPLDKIPPQRLDSWPLTRGQRLALRLASLGLSPVLWLTVSILLLTSPALALFFLGVAVGIQSLIVCGSRWAARVPAWNPQRSIPQLPGRLGGMIRNDMREMLSLLDPYLAALLAIAGSAYRLLSAHPDPSAFPILALLVALALSTYAQCLFGLDSASGVSRFRLLPLRGWQILLAKDIAFLGILWVLVLPLSPGPGMTFGFAALAIGHFPSVGRHSPQRRWRFTGGKLVFGVAQMLSGFMLGLAEYQQGVWFLAVTSATWLVSLYRCGKLWEAGR